IAAPLLMVPLARLVLAESGWLVAVGPCAGSHHGMTPSYEGKPYAEGLLVSEVVLVAGAACVLPPASPHRQRNGRAALLAGAALGPWFSFPSVFMLGGASAALFLLAWQRRRRADWIYWLALNGTILLSCLLLWQATQHQDTPGLHQWWAAYFL